MILFEDGASFDEKETEAQSGRKMRKGFKEEKVEKERGESGQLSIAAIARCKSRYFVESAVWGEPAMG